MRSSIVALLQWNLRSRVLVFVLASTSIACLLLEMYGIGDMRAMFFAAFLPATALLIVLAVLDRRNGSGVLARAAIVGALAGILGAIVYDIFRLPFVFSDAWKLSPIGIPQMPLFKVFPRFGALLLAEPIEQGVLQGDIGFAWGKGYSWSAQLLGWLYHFSNGATFGIMFMAAFAGRATTKRVMLGAILMAVDIEAALLLSPYSTFFGIHQTATFVVVTLLAHIVFGVGLGAGVLWLRRR